MAEDVAKYNASTIAEMNNGIILANFEKDLKVRETSYQSEAELERNLISNLVSQGYERIFVKSNEQMYENLKVQIERLNNISFSSSEWERFLLEYLDCPNDGMVEKTRKIQENHIYDFIFDDGEAKNIKIIDKKNIHNNFLQVTNQVCGEGKCNNRYDVTILVNGLPLVHIELKKRGVNLHEAFNQIHRYSKESFNSQNSLYKFVQIFVISNGTYTRYFANTTAQNKNNYEFTCEWADAKNKVICDLEDFTKTFFEKRVLLEVLTKYCVFDVNNTLLIMRPYQIAATERILWKIKSSYEAKKAGSAEAGGFIWHTTGSGKTLTSFKAARLATNLDFIDKVFFVVDRKDLDFQTMKEYQRFQPDSVNGSKDTKELKNCIESNDNKIIVTTIQKLNEFVKKNPNHEIYDKDCVLIYDECHRSQFGDAQKNIRKSFKKYYQFGFTGTPIFAENALGSETTSSIFGAQLHSYVITDAIRDGKVLKFKVDYNNIEAKFKSAEKEDDLKKLKKLENKMLLHPDRISEITKYVLDVFDTKTHRNEFYDLKHRRINGFNAMFAVSSVDAAKLYYEEFEKQQRTLPKEKRLKVATIYSFAANEEQRALGEISDESFDVSAMDSSSKEFLEKVIDDYNGYFKTNYSTNGNEFQNYYKDLSLRVQKKEVDLLIVVGMFLTGFDAPCLNTLFVDKNLRYHGLIQAFSRTNRILNKVKTFGNIVCFRDLEKATKDAIKTFGDENSVNVILEKSYQEYMQGFKDEESGKVTKGYIDICNELLEKFPEPTEISLDTDKKEFVEIFGELLKSENILRNFDEFSNFDKIISDRLMQDMKSVYVDIRDNISKPNGKGNSDGIQIDFSDVEFQIDLLKTDEINLDYILTLILEKSKENEDIENLKSEVRRVIRSSLGTRAKEELVMDFINKTDLSKLKNNDDILEAFYTFARVEKENKIESLIKQEKLKDKAHRFIEKSISKGYVEYAGEDLDKIIPPTSRRHGAREKKKASILEKIRQIVEVFVGI
ncbi:type I restriction endonuclease subunit R [Anaerococcus hydrogenalis]|uniref:Type I restriction enzyme endonuclease subunit n=1 Tax=Anaerococcus hydrogenalis TaxID=33029 RepID=A0A2N6UH15_9FIRM|nr:type I restriction endonuclease subunit R [Anaerococcus hydrogenalis]MDK7695595.1 type I restriction endonuclease subunit R [Anaerococcus hydrogenalis]MDK7697354.1 type I restriction endonuclease subunit R [Anaerococcus hydrogenalis]MDK7708666.1 type I restriction endonuclease subunit R [Anaerococcus hydrogenalis]PMC80898.1 DEAD/DEAH box helicase [Anaerococcus hydrogenalis]